MLIPKTRSSLGLLNYVLKLFWVGEAFLAQTNTYRTKICLSTHKIRLTRRKTRIQPTGVNQPMMDWDGLHPAIGRQQAYVVPNRLIVICSQISFQRYIYKLISLCTCKRLSLTNLFEFVPYLFQVISKEFFTKFNVLRMIAQLLDCLMQLANHLNFSTKKIYQRPASLNSERSINVANTIRLCVTPFGNNMTMQLIHLMSTVSPRTYMQPTCHWPVFSGLNYYINGTGILCIATLTDDKSQNFW